MLPLFWMLGTRDQRVVAEGDPEIKPVAVFNESPAGNPVAENEVGALVAVIW